MSDTAAVRATVAALRAAGCVFAEDEARLLHEATTDPGERAGLLERRVAGEPLEYVLGWARFRARRYVIEPGVFVPRHRSDLLVETALGLVHAGNVVLDLCCGTGALVGAVQDECGVAVHVVAADIDPAAVRCASRNLRADVFQSDLFDALPDSLRGRIDLLLVNAPYVPTDEIALLPPEAREHEARAALDGGRDGTDVQRRVLAGAREWLSPGGALLTETGADQAGFLAEAATAAGLVARLVAEDGTTVLVAVQSVS